MPMLAILTNCPDEATADTIAEGLVLARLAACANRYAPITSLYRWEGSLARTTEIPLLLKTRPELAARAEAEIRRLHPYDCPPILRVPLEANADFLSWIADETSA